VRTFVAEPRATPPAGVRWINAGVYLLEHSVLDWIPPGRFVSLEHETFPRLLESGQAVYALTFQGYFVDIGTPASYRRFARDVSRGRIDAISKQSASSH
jgi:NDP-sugar pyrophosphorylase family protein